jgi:hypothetical protein
MESNHKTVSVDLGLLSAMTIANLFFFSPTTRSWPQILLFVLFSNMEPCIPGQISEIHTGLLGLHLLEQGWAQSLICVGVFKCGKCHAI